MGNLVLVRAVGTHGPNLGDNPILGEAPPDDATAVGAEEGAAVVAGGIGQAADIRPVRVHEIDVHEE